jgi:hypothetical protein
MRNRLSCNRARQPRAIEGRTLLVVFSVLMIALACPPCSTAGTDAPQWAQALVSAPLPAHDEKTDAVLLYSEQNVTVISADKVKTQVREAYKILRPSGRHYGTVVVSFNPPRSKVTSLHGWCIPAQGRDYEVKDKDAVESSPPMVDGGELVSDVKVKVLRIPASDPGNIVAYEYELEERPLVLEDNWVFQEESPVRESHYSLQLPSGWEYRASWLNSPETKPTQSGSGAQWMVSDVKAIRSEQDMPPFSGVAGQMIVSFFPPGGPAANGFSSWQQMGRWYQNLTSGRRDASPEIKQQVSLLTASETTPLAKMNAIAQFLQRDIRYVAIELGIGGFQPHAAPDVFLHRYGDCKDKVTLMSSMLHEIGIDSYYVLINTRRGAVTPEMPAHSDGFNHAILAIRLPDDVTDRSLIATVHHPRLGTMLFFDPTNELTPFGQIGGYLQANWGLLVTPDGGELVELPEEPAAMNSVERTAKLTLDASGTLEGEVKEVRVGDRARSQRHALRNVMKETEKIKPIELLLADSLSMFDIEKASVINLQQNDRPFGFEYSFSAPHYATSAGDLLLVRPRVLGSKALPLLETSEPRLFPIEFEGPARDTDTFEIALPPGYQVDDLPPPVDADFGFASYHSKSEVKGNVIRYTREFEVKQLSVPVSKAEELKKFYRIVATDERNTAVLKPAGR